MSESGESTGPRSAAAPEKKLSLAERARQSVEQGLKKTREDGTVVGGDAVARMVATQRLTRWIRRILTAIVLLVMIYGVIRYEIYRFPANYRSMLPAFGPGQSVVVDRFPSTFPSMIPDMKTGDVVIYNIPREDGSQAQRVARILGRPGDTVAIGSTEDGEFHFTVNGERVHGPGPRYDEDGTPHSAARGEVPGGHFFVLEDAGGTSSFDSRDFGFLPFDNVYGRVALSWRNSGAPTETVPVNPDN